MPELSEILASREIEHANLGGDLDIAGQLTAGGIVLPQVPASGASMNSIFFNTDTQLVSWKSVQGTVLRFNLSL